MNMKDCWQEEDLFPKRLTAYEQRPYGWLFYNDENKDSFDSNHALLYRDRIGELGAVLEEITRFYQKKGIAPAVYQAVCDEGYFEENRDVFAAHGYDVWTEEQRYMLLTAPNTLRPAGEILVKRETVWKDAFAREIFEKADEPWETAVAKRTMQNPSTLFFAAYIAGKPVGMTYCHTADDVCRLDYLLIAKEYRRRGVARSLICHLVDECRAKGITNCFLWPDGETAERIYHEAGFRYVETKLAGRAALRRD